MYFEAKRTAQNNFLYTPNRTFVVGTETFKYIYYITNDGTKFWKGPSGNNSVTSRVGSVFR